MCCKVLGKNNKSGSVVIFVVMIFMALIIFIYALLTNARDVAVKGATEQLSQVWGDSVLGEYDRYLYDEYGIFGFYGYEASVSDTLKYYALETFKDKRYITLDGVSSTLSDFSLINIKNFKKQLIEASKSSLLDISKYKGENREKSGGENEKAEREINNKRILNSLPSKSIKDSFSISDAVSGLKSITGDGSLSESAGDKFYEQRYMNYYFNSYRNHTSDVNSYYNNEKEYLLSGKTSDESNLESYKKRFIAVRNAINIAYLYTDATKREITLTLAEAITPGPAALATQAVLMETWALFEAKNDWKLIANGKKVPVLKTAQNWALDEDVLKDDDYDGYVDNNCDTGLEYDDYLNFFITLQDEKMTLFRMMDLIQINMRYNHYDDFLISEYNVGFKYCIGVNGDNYEYTRKY